MIPMETTARRQLRSEAENLRQPVGVVHLWWVFLGFFTLLIVLVPGLRVTFTHDALSFTLETFNALVATMVSFVALARYFFQRQLLDATIAAAFGSIAVSSLWFGLILPFRGYTFHSIGNGPVWGWTLTRLVVVILLLLGLPGWEAGRQRLARFGSRLGLSVLFVALADVAIWRWSDRLPTLLRSNSWQAADLSGRVTASVLAGQTPVGMMIESLVAVLFFWLAYRLTLAVRHGEETWLALAMIAAAVGQFQFIFFPAPFHPAITTSDLLWLVASILLLAHLGHQYILASGSMRRQQERTRALLALSQTPVISRNPALVFDAARAAVSAAGQEVAVRLKVGGDDEDVTASDFCLSVPISRDSVRYGMFEVKPVDGEDLREDVEEYVRVVANQTANLLRSIELYDELARGAVRDERAQLARDLHDGLAQDLAVLRLRLADEPHGTGSSGLADRALSEARYAITILRGQTAAPADFLEALQRQSDDLSDRFGCPVVVEQEGPITGISGVAQVALLRICREAITNAGKHGKPSRIVLSVRQLDESVEMEVTDDGAGFDPTAPVRPGAFGLTGMAERAALRGGKLVVKSRPSGGTSVKVRLPNTEGLRDQ